MKIHRLLPRINLDLFGKLSNLLAFGRGQSTRNRSSTAEAQIQRHIRVNDREFNESFHYASNFVNTSKYTIIYLLLKNFAKQFKRWAYGYFVMLTILQGVSFITSTPWETTIAPLASVLVVSVVKDVWDDCKRHRSNRLANHHTCSVVKENKLIKEKWSNLRVGDIIRVDKDQPVAADILLLSSTEPSGMCYIETAELDGETNLKYKQSFTETSSQSFNLSEISHFKGEIVCGAPNNRLNQFDGSISFDGRQIVLDNDNILLRGCVLRNTRWCYGVVLFAGRETKLMMNIGKTKLKTTSLDKVLNVLMVNLFLFLVTMCLICTILCGIWEWTTGRFFTDYSPYDQTIPIRIENDSEQIALIAFLIFWSYMILLNTVIPISLYVSIDILRFVHAKLINSDREMYYEKNDIAASARATSLSDELGQVQYIFSDKTGTLTQNIMTFKKCSINGTIYGVDDGQNSKVKAVDFSFNRWSEPNFTFYDYDEKLLFVTRDKKNKKVCIFWRLLALCHTIVVPKQTDGKLEYQAQSPDEGALTSAARNFGYVFKARTSDSITVEVDGKEEKYELLDILDFDNVRKRMSVIVRDDKNEIMLFCKGADTLIMERIISDCVHLKNLKTETELHLKKFAADGLRTLCLAYKKLDKKYYDGWSLRKEQASLNLHDRQEKLDELYDEIETGMWLLGATGIEDKLQDGVPETIAKLASANIKIWMLTGDKQETAINIGFSSHLLTEQMKDEFVIDGEHREEVRMQLEDIRRQLQKGSPRESGTDLQANGMGASMRELNETNSTATSTGHGNTCSSSEDNGYALIINGRSLAHALHWKLETAFFEIACLCQAVICCRITPKQKADVVELFKRYRKTAVTLAIGDGANDVTMIKTAHIGVAISGGEGIQAVLAADYCIGQFRFLQRLLLVHGRWSYFRMAKFLRYFFYKNFAFTLTHFWYSFFIGHSAQTIYDSTLITCYNLLFTALPVLAMGIFDQDVDDEYSVKYAKLYIPGQRHLFFNSRIFVYGLLRGIISSLVLFFVPYGALRYSIDRDGHNLDDYPMLGFIIFTGLIIVVTGQIALDTSYWTVWNRRIICFSLAYYFGVVILLYEVFPIFMITWFKSSFWAGTPFRAFASIQFWFIMLLLVVILLLPTLVNRFFSIDTNPSYADRLRVRRRMPAFIKTVKSDVSSRKLKRAGITRQSRRTKLRSGYAFSHQFGFGDLITKGKMIKNQSLSLLTPKYSSRSTSPVGRNVDGSERLSKSASQTVLGVPSPVLSESSSASSSSLHVYAPYQCRIRSQ